MNPPLILPVRSIRTRLLAGMLIVATQLVQPLQAGPPRVYAWGDNTDSQTNLPVTLTNVMRIAAGYYHGLGLHSNGTVTSWGHNLHGQTNNQPTLTNVMAIAGGGYHSLALRSNGIVYGWGLNTQNQRTVPASLSGVKAISAGNAHSMALVSNGMVVVWGSTSSGKTNVPAGLTNVVTISAGDDHCLALRNDGTVVGWGNDDSDQASVPANITNIMAIVAGYHHNLAVRSNGTVAAWGVNVYGETVVPPGLSNVVAVAAGYFHSAALRSDGTVLAWGQDFSGVTNVPVGLNGVTAIAGGWEFSLALSTTLLCPPGFPDAFECRQVLAGGSVTNVISNLGATRESDEPLHGGVPTTNSLWYSWTAPGSGSVVIEATGGSDFATPILAVYTGTSLATLSNVAFNFAPFSGSGSPLNKARVAFTAVSNQTYQIAVDGKPTSSFDSEGVLTFKLTLTPPPANDLFANAAAIAGVFLEITNATFRGASRESGEPTHGTNFAQTVWWTWTAPANLGVSAIPARLSADAVSHAPAIGVYTGNTVAALTPVMASQSADGMSRTATFLAVPGTAYHFALAGLQNDVEAVLTLVGNFRFRFNTRALALTINNVNGVLNSTQAVQFTATASVTNLGAATSGPLRVRVTSIPGISMRGLNVVPITESPAVLGDWPATALAPGQFTNLAIAGTAPPHSETPPGTSSALGYGVHAELQELSGTNWITVDETLVGYGDWPDLAGLPGPGGGVIRLDPGFIGLSAFNPLASVRVLGPATAFEAQPAFYFGRATYANNTQVNFTNTIWLATLPRITNGLFTPGIVSSNRTVTLTAQFSNSGFLYSASTNILVFNLPAALLKEPKTIGGDFIVRIEGVSNRSHVVEAATNLASPQVWLTLRTNTIDATGRWNFTNSLNLIPQRFFRVREVE
ncbi:MAG: hypothetical protein H7Y43_01515 [Akkermansiaceae bacterium]|nr:hypothetical protein [Verrucomicrobiales bacterium]